MEDLGYEGNDHEFIHCDQHGGKGGITKSTLSKGQNVAMVIIEKVLLVRVSFNTIYCCEG